MLLFEWAVERLRYCTERVLGKDSIEVGVITAPKSLICFNLSTLRGNDSAKELVVGFVVRRIIERAYQQMEAGKHPRSFLIVLDDMLRPDWLLESLIREHRRDGISVIGSSQVPTDISEVVLANCGTLIVLRTQSLFWNLAARLLGITRAFAKTLGELKPGIAFVKQRGKPGPDIVHVQPLSKAEIDAAREKVQQALKEK